MRTYALLDEDSTVTITDASVAKTIGASGPKVVLSIQGIKDKIKDKKQEGAPAAGGTNDKEPVPS